MNSKLILVCFLALVCSAEAGGLETGLMAKKWGFKSEGKTAPSFTDRKLWEVNWDGGANDCGTDMNNDCWTQFFCSSICAGSAVYDAGAGDACNAACNGDANCNWDGSEFNCWGGDRRRNLGSSRWNTFYKRAQCMSDGTGRGCKGGGGMGTMTPRMDSSQVPRGGDGTASAGNTAVQTESGCDGSIEPNNAKDYMSIGSSSPNHRFSADIETRWSGENRGQKQKLVNEYCAGCDKSSKDFIMAQDGGMLNGGHQYPPSEEYYYGGLPPHQMDQMREEMMAAEVSGAGGFFEDQLHEMDQVFGGNYGAVADSYAAADSYMATGDFSGFVDMFARSRNMFSNEDGDEWTSFYSGVRKNLDTATAFRLCLEENANIMGYCTQIGDGDCDADNLAVLIKGGKWDMADLKALTVDCVDSKAISWLEKEANSVEKELLEANLWENTAVPTMDFIDCVAEEEHDSNQYFGRNLRGMQKMPPRSKCIEPRWVTEATRGDRTAGKYRSFISGGVSAGVRFTQCMLDMLEDYGFNDLAEAYGTQGSDAAWRDYGVTLEKWADDYAAQIMYRCLQPLSFSWALGGNWWSGYMYKRTVSNIVRSWSTGHNCWDNNGNDEFCANLAFKDPEYWGVDADSQTNQVAACAIDVINGLGFDTENLQMRDPALWAKAFSTQAGFEALKSCFGETHQSLTKMGLMSLLIGLANFAPAADCKDVAINGFAGAPWDAVDVVSTCFPGGWLDMNGDGRVDSTDGVMVSQHPRGGAFREMANYWSGAQAVWGDCNNDGRRDYGDAYCIYYGGGDRSTFAHRSIYWNVAGAGPSVIMGIQAANAAYCETDDWDNMHGGQRGATWHGITRDADYLTEDTVFTGRAHCKATGVMGYVAHHPKLGCFASPRGAVTYEYNGVYDNQIMTVVVEWVGMAWSQNNGYNVHSGYHDSVYGTACDGTSPEADPWGTQMKDLLGNCAGRRNLYMGDYGMGDYGGSSWGMPKMPQMGLGEATFIGHSMGGSISNLLAADWMHNGGQASVVTYGQTRVFDEAGARWVDSRANSYYRVTNGADYAPFVPYRGNGGTGSGCAYSGPGAQTSIFAHLGGCVAGNHPSYPHNPDFNFCGDLRVNCGAAWYMSGEGDCKWTGKSCKASGPSYFCKNGVWQHMYVQTMEYMYCGVDYVHSGSELHENTIGWVDNVGGPDSLNGIMQHADNSDHWVCFASDENDANCFWGFGQYGAAGIAPHAMHLHTVQPGCWSG